MINQKISVLHPICWLILSLFICCAPKPNSMPENEFGLVVVRKSKIYWANIQTDSNKRMIDLASYVPGLKTDFKYAGTNNFTHKRLYKNPGAFVRLPVAKSILKVQQELNTRGLGLKIFDAYRPYSVTKEMWKIVPDARYAANPAKGSGHNRGVAVDLTLIELAGGSELAMPTPFDDFTEKAHHNYNLLPDLVRANRALLKSVMEKYGFIALDTEWWHYYLPESSRYELMDFNFNQMQTLVKPRSSNL